jgi:hypothetical protein
MKNKGSGTQLILGMTGMEAQLGSFGTVNDASLKLRLPETFAPSDIKRIARDCEVLKQKLDNDPGAMRELLTLVVGGRFAEARSVAEKLKLTEEDFAADGGGLIWLAVAAAAAVLLWATDAY